MQDGSEMVGQFATPTHTLIVWMWSASQSIVQAIIFSKGIGVYCFGSGSMAIAVDV